MEECINRIVLLIKAQLTDNPLYFVILHVNTGTLDWNYSDHQAIYVTRKKTFTKHSKMEFRGRSYIIKNMIKIFSRKILGHMNGIVFSILMIQMNAGLFSLRELLKL